MKEETLEAMHIASRVSSFMDLLVGIICILFRRIFWHVIVRLLVHRFYIFFLVIGNRKHFVNLRDFIGDKESSRGLSIHDG